MADLTMQTESGHFSPYRADGKLYGFVCVVTGADEPIGAAIVSELAGIAILLDQYNTLTICSPWGSLNLRLHLFLRENRLAHLRDRTNLALSTPRA